MDCPGQSSWADLLRSYRQRAGLTKTALARELGVTIGYISKLESGQRPPPERQRYGMCDALNMADEETQTFHIQAELERTDPTAVRYLLELREARQEGDRHVHHEVLEDIGNADSLPLIPIINKVAAGYPQEFTDLDYPVGIADDYISLPNITDPNAFAFHVFGDSMEPDYPAGGLAVAAPNSVAFDGDPCFVRFSAVSSVSGCTFKRAYSMPDGKIRLVPINRQYPEQIYEHDEINGRWPVIVYCNKISRGGAKSHRRSKASDGRLAGAEPRRPSQAAG